jgi:hypothetical protein
MDFDPIDALGFVVIFAVIAAFTWRDGRAAFAYICAAFIGISAAIYTIRNGLSDAAYLWALTLALLILGFVRGLMPTKP